MTNRAEQIVIGIKSAETKGEYFRTERGQWAGDVRKAKEYDSVEEAKREVDRIGIATFMIERCIPRVMIVRDLHPERRQNKGRDITEIAPWLVTEFRRTESDIGVIAYIDIVFKDAIHMTVEMSHHADGRTEVALPEHVAVAEPFFDEIWQAIEKALLSKYDANADTNLAAQDT